MMLEFRTGDGSEMVALAALACDVPDEIDDAPVFAAIRQAAGRPTTSRMPPSPRTARHASAADLGDAAVAMTPDVPLRPRA